MLAPIASAPGLRTREQISAVIAAVAPKPVNVLIGWDTDLTVQDLADLGVRRISVGGALARTAWAGFLRAARSLPSTAVSMVSPTRPPVQSSTGCSIAETGHST